MPTIPQQFTTTNAHPLFRVSLVQTITEQYAERKIQLVDDIPTLNGLLAKRQPVELLLLDLSLPGIDGFSGLILLLTRYQNVPVLAVSDSESPKVIAKALEYGAAGYLSTASTAEEIDSAIACVLHDGLWIPPDIGTVQGSLSDDESHAAAFVAKLTPPQFRLVHALASGMRNPQIVKALNYSDANLKKQLAVVYKKLGVKTRKQAVLELNRMSLLLNATTTTIQ